MPRSCLFYATSVRFILPLAVTVIMSLILGTSMYIMTQNTYSSVSNIISSMHNHVLFLVEGKCIAKLGEVYDSANAVSGYLRLQQWLPKSIDELPPIDVNLKGSIPHMYDILKYLEFYLSITHVMGSINLLLPNGRTFGFGKLRESPLMMVYLEESIEGLKLLSYTMGNVSSIAYTPDRFVGIRLGYRGANKTFFNTTILPRVPGSHYFWPPVVSFEPFVFRDGSVYNTSALSLGMTIMSPQGDFQGILVVNIKFEGMKGFLISTRPTIDSKTVVSIPGGFILATSDGAAMDPTQSKILRVWESDDAVIASFGIVLQKYLTNANTATPEPLRQTLVLGGSEWIASYETLLLNVTDNINIPPITIIVMTPAAFFLEKVRRDLQETLLMTGAIALIGILLIVALCVSIASALGRLIKDIDAASRLEVTEDSEISPLLPPVENSLFPESDGFSTPTIPPVSPQNNDSFSVGTPVSTNTNGSTPHTPNVSPSFAANSSVGSIVVNSNNNSNNNSNQNMKATNSTSTAKQQQTQQSTTNVFSELRAANDSFNRLKAAIVSFGKYVPQGVVNGIMDGTIRPKPNMHSAHVAVCFFDIENFTNMCETTAIRSVVHQVTEVFEYMSSKIQHNGGSVDKFIGDAIMAYWHEGNYGNVDAKETCRRAVVTIYASLTLNSALPHIQYIRLRSGCNYGKVLMGNFGARRRYNYTVVGDTVNIAARLENINREIGTRAVVAQEVLDTLPPEVRIGFYTRYVGKIHLYGKLQPTKVHEVRLNLLPSEPQRRWDEIMSAYEDMSRDGDLSGLHELEKISDKLAEYEKWFTENGGNALDEDPCYSKLKDCVFEYLKVPEAWDGTRKQTMK
eukprot:PhF_6_TR4518/c0_g1_i1/m.6314/K01768/E4.6.1.1; adenylate cyclase